MKELVLFIITYFIVLFIYEVFIVSKTKRRKRKKSKKFKDPIEVKYLVTKYNLDMEKLNYDYLLQVVAVTSSFDIALVVSVLTHINNYILEILIALIGIYPVILISYHFVYKYFLKKGMIKND